MSVFRRIESVDLKGSLAHELDGRLSQEWIRQVEMEARVEDDDPSVVPSSELKIIRLIGNMPVELARLMSLCSRDRRRSGRDPFLSLDETPQPERDKVEWLFLIGRISSKTFYRFTNSLDDFGNQSLRK